MLYVRLLQRLRMGCTDALHFILNASVVCTSGHAKSSSCNH